MNIYIRRAMLFLAYTAFVIIAPLVILYAMGYRPRISSPTPHPVGVILADALPKGATISLDEKSHGSLPKAIPNIEPGLVRVRVEKLGYTPWEKVLEVKPTQATDIRSIRLLPASFPAQSLIPNVRLFAFSPDDLMTATVNNANELIIHDALAAPITSPQKLGSEPAQLAWSPDSSYLLVRFPQHAYQIFRIENSRAEKVPAKNFSLASEAVWSGVEQDTLYGITANRSLVSYNVRTDTTAILARDINAYTPYGRDIYYQTIQNDLKKISLRTLEEEIVQEDMGKQIKKMTISQSGTLAILFANGQLMLQKTQGETEEISPFAEDMQWSPDGQLLLIHTTPMELHVYNVENERLFAVPQGALHLVTRLSHRIMHPQWYSDSLHILYQTKEGLFFSEIDTRDHAAVTHIESEIPPQNIWIGKGGESLFYAKPEGKTATLVQTWLFTEQDR